MISPDLKKGDRIILLHMEDDNPVFMGTKGTVTKKTQVFGDTQYEVDWDNGSRLSIIQGVDKWDLLDNFEKRRNRTKINEMDVENFKELISKPEIFKYFDSRFLKKYLIAVRDSGITNMFAAAPYLYMGSERISHDFKYQPVHNEEAFELVLDMADEARSKMIIGTMKTLESKDIEITPENVQRYMRIYSIDILKHYILTF